MTFLSPLRYPGGKGKVADYFKEIVKRNNLYDGTYVEPYAGGCSVALSLLFNAYVSKIVINDIDTSIHSFWHSVLNNTDELCQMINDTPVNVKNWKIQKDIQRNKNRYGKLKVGFSTFYLNRTNRSGIINAGIIGGKEQAGKWKLDVRFNKKDLIQRIQTIALYSSKIELHNDDAIRLVRKIKKNLPEKTLFYFDPPYYHKGKELYLNHYEPGDHKAVATEIASINRQKWIVTYDSTKAITDLYSNFRQATYSLSYTAGTKNTGQEVMVFSDNIKIVDTSKI